MSVLSAGQDLARIQERLLRTQREATSGTRVARPSDDPTGAAKIVRADADSTALEQCQSNTQAALGELGTVDGVLDSVEDLLTQASELAVQMANGTVSVSERAVAATQVQSIRAQILALANTDQNGVHLFGGYNTSVDPFNPAGVPVGDVSGVRRVLAAPGLVLEASVSGAEVFTAAGGRDVLADLATLATALQTNDQAGVSAAIATMTADHQQVTAARARAGIQAVRLQAVDEGLRARLVNVAENRSLVADADMVTTLTSLARTQSALNGALQVAAEMLSKLSLVDKL